MAGDVFVAERAKSGTGLSALVRHWLNLRQHRIAPQESWMRFKPPVCCPKSWKLNGENEGLNHQSLVVPWFQTSPCRDASNAFESYDFVMDVPHIYIHVYYRLIDITCCFGCFDVKSRVAGFWSIAHSRAHHLGMEIQNAHWLLPLQGPIADLGKLSTLLHCCWHGPVGWLGSMLP